MSRQESQAATEIEPASFREVLGHYPTGVAVITSMGPDGPLGMAVGSFSSVSLDPPLVGFMPDRSSTTWPRIEPLRRFCANVLAAHQEPVCRAFAKSGGDKFADVPWALSAGGLPVLDGVLAWVECETEAVHEAGDHFIVLGRVRTLGTGGGTAPLVFFRGGYGRFADA